jgi:glycerol-3-phosphate acyltransferase PlsY
MSLVLLLVLAYLAGSFPTSLLVVRWRKGVDLRDYGSGNAGATNVSRLLGWGWGSAVIAVDLLKGVLAVSVLLPLLDPPGDPVTLGGLAGLACVLGHVFPVFAGFRGGKGVATAAGVCLALNPWPAAVALAVFAGVLGGFRYMFLASLSGGLAYLLSSLLVFHDTGILAVLAVVLPAALFWLHRRNIARFRRGEEQKIGVRIPVERTRP